MFEIDTQPSGRCDASHSAKPVFVDVYAGCGGLSFGLMRAGWSGLFAIEKEENAFSTLAANLLHRSGGCQFAWPSWLPKRPASVAKIMRAHRTELQQLKGQIDMVVGGPPCQGFSSAGRRDPFDPRNRLIAEYLRFVSMVDPKLVLMENVRGITMEFRGNRSHRTVNYADRLRGALAERYVVHSIMLDVSRFGVPQRRRRFFLIAIRRDIAGGEHVSPFAMLESGRLDFLRAKGLRNKVSARSAISDLEINRNGTRPSRETPGFLEIGYSRPVTNYQRLMRIDAKGQPPDTRLARHARRIERRFFKIIELCQAESRLNVSLSKKTRRLFGIEKCALRVLDPDAPAPTITSMPDDLLHYREPRTLTVRECARLQGFPDSFEFHGKYTTGGKRRRQEVPRFTQVANAVPPLVAEAIGRTLLEIVSRSSWRTADPAKHRRERVKA